MPSTPRFYSERTLLVEAYDALHATDMSGKPIEGDAVFYRELAEEQGGPIVDLGCGTGRIAFFLAEVGFEVVGLDRSEPMLAIAESKRRAAPREIASRVKLVAGDMADFELVRRFRLVVIAFRSFANLLTVAAQRSCLAAVRRHLEPGGVLTIDLFDPRLDLCVPDPPGEYPQPRGEATLPDSGNRVEVVATERRNDPLRQVLTEVWRLTERSPDGGIVRQENEELVLRWTYRYELHHLLELAGFELVAEYSDFAKSPSAYGRELIVVARAR